MNILENAQNFISNIKTFKKINIFTKKENFNIISKNLDKYKKNENARLNDCQLSMYETENIKKCLDLINLSQYKNDLNIITGFSYADIKKDIKELTKNNIYYSSSLCWKYKSPSVIEMIPSLKDAFSIYLCEKNYVYNLEKKYHFFSQQYFIKELVEEFIRQKYNNDLFLKIIYLESILNYFFKSKVYKYKYKNIYDLNKFKLKINSSALIIDGGAGSSKSVGEYTTYFSKFVKNGYVIAFEPDKKTFNELKNDILFKKNIKAYNLYVSDINKKKYIKLDEFIFSNKSFSNKEVNLIKLDIEGYELKALKGASEIIKKKPNLIISVYHRSNDLYLIIEYLKSLNAMYRFRLELNEGYPYIGMKLICY